MTTQTAPSEAETITLTRPDGISDGRWVGMQNMATLVVTGHYPWCNDHEGEPFTLDGYCRRVDESRVARVTLTNGTLSGAMVAVYEVDGVDFGELSVDQAAVLGDDVARAARLGMEFNVSGDPA